MAKITYRDLNAQDAEAIRRLRMAVLVSDPNTFSITLTEEQAQPVSGLKQALATYEQATDCTVIGAFDEELVGMIMFSRMQGQLTQHKAQISGLYIAPDHRRLGIGNTLVRRTLEFAKKIGDVETLLLDVTASATEAIRLYQRFGFTIIHTEPRALKIGHRYLDSHKMELGVK